MPLPLVMTGPGGAYVNRYEPHGSRLLQRQLAGPDGQPDHPDTESGHGNASWQRPGRRRGRPDQQAGDESDGRRRSPIDTFERRATGEAVDADPGPQPWVREGLLAAAASAIEAWLASQSTDLREASRSVLAMRQAARGEAAPPALRLNRDHPTRPAPGRNVQPSRSVGATDPQRMERCDESDPEATTDFDAHPRLPAHPRLFADDAGARRTTRRQQSHRLRAHRGAAQKGRPAARSQQGTLFGAYEQVSAAG